MIYLVVKGGDTILTAHAIQTDAERHATETRQFTQDSVQIVAVELAETDMGIHDQEDACRATSKPQN